MSEHLKPFAFQPGKSGNESGRPKLPEDIVEARKLNQVELERVINRFLYLDRSQLKKVVETPGTPMIEVMVASIMAQAAQKGDQMRLEFIFQRLIGKVPEKIQVSASKADPLPSPAEALRILNADFAVLPAAEVKIDEL